MTRRNNFDEYAECCRLVVNFPRGFRRAKNGRLYECRKIEITETLNQKQCSNVGTRGYFIIVVRNLFGVRRCSIFVIRLRRVTRHSNGIVISVSRILRRTIGIVSRTVDENDERLRAISHENRITGDGVIFNRDNSESVYEYARVWER